MSIISVYRLNPDGTVPEYVIDGGYFPHGVDGAAPQDVDLVGVTTNEAPGVPFANADSLATYLASIGGALWTDPEGNPVDLAAAAAALWARR